MSAGPSTPHWSYSGRPGRSRPWSRCHSPQRQHASACSSASASRSSSATDEPMPRHLRNRDAPGPHLTVPTQWFLRPAALYGRGVFCCRQGHEVCVRHLASVRAELCAAVAPRMLTCGVPRDKSENRRSPWLLCEGAMSAAGEVISAGFLVAADVVCTCAHVVARLDGEVVAERDSVSSPSGASVAHRRCVHAQGMYQAGSRRPHGLGSGQGYLPRRSPGQLGL